MSKTLSKTVSETASKKRSLLRSNVYTVMRILGVVVTLIVLLGYTYVPSRSLVLWPSDSYQIYAYNGDGNHDAEVVNSTHFSCNYENSSTYSCGTSIFLSEDRVSGINLDDFDYLLIRASYKGDANRFRIVVRNYNPVYSKGDPETTSKIMLTIVRSEDFNRNANIKLSEFGVAEWWIRSFDIPRKYTAPEFSNVLSISFDFIDFGHHELELQKVALVGAWVSKEKLYLVILSIWLVLITWEGIHRFWLIYLESKRSGQKIGEMVELNNRLEIEKNQYKAESTTDKLTGVANRAGIENYVKKVFSNDYENYKLGLVVFDIDHFKRINDTYGHDVGDRVIEDVARLISTNIREVDVLGRWGGEEFILVAPQISLEHLVRLASELREVVEAHSFEAEKPFSVTISAGVAAVGVRETFESAFKKADLALYEAKNQGRNRVVAAT